MKIKTIDSLLNYTISNDTLLKKYVQVNMEIFVQIKGKRSLYLFQGSHLQNMHDVGGKWYPFDITSLNMIYHLLTKPELKEVLKSYL